MEPTVGRWGYEWPSWLVREKVSSRTRADTKEGFKEGSRVLKGRRPGDNDKSLTKLIEAKQVNGIWPLIHPLPLPIWENEPVKTYKLKSIKEYEVLASEIEMHLQKLLEEHNYDTVGNLIEFYENFKMSGCKNVLEFSHR